MVTVKLFAALGNQMFQYALGRTIAHRRRTSLAMDISAYRTHWAGEYSLGVFKIVENLTSATLTRIGRRLRRACDWVRIPGLPHVLVERGHPFDPLVLEAPRRVYLVGYWQSEKYFKEIEDIIRREFSFKAEPDQQNGEMANRIKALNAVAVHVRRTDRVTHPVVMGTCPLEYYREAVQFVASRISNPHFFVFSDEPEWVRAHLKLEGPTTIVAQNPPDKGYEDLRLMSLCRHHIIANSTFSWWGAWLAEPGGIVVAPKKWFNDTSPLDARDIVPDRWIRL